MSYQSLKLFWLTDNNEFTDNVLSLMRKKAIFLLRDGVSVKWFGQARAHLMKWKEDNIFEMIHYEI